eukprot:s90_g9.t1
MAVTYKMELLRPAPLQLPQEPPSPVGSLVFTPVNAPSTYWRTTICPAAPYKRDPPSQGSTPRSGPPTPAVLWPSPTNWSFEPSFELTPTAMNTLSSAFPDAFNKPTKPTLRRACTLPPAHEIVDDSSDEEVHSEFHIDRTVSEPHVAKKALPSVGFKLM